MDFYISWSHSDPHYPLYDNNCNLLVSPAGVTRNFRMTRFRAVPKRLLLDSGGYGLRRRIEAGLTQRELFEWQMSILEGLDTATTHVLLTHLDQPIDPGLEPGMSYRRLERTISNAWDFLSLVDRSGLWGRFELLGVIQGYDRDSIQWCCRELRRLGFDRFGLGSLAALYQPKVIEERVQAAIEVVGTGLHVFGITSMHVLKALHRLGVASVDSSRPMREAMYHVIDYSRPFRRFVIGNRGYMRKQQLEQPLPCQCPVCTEDPYLILTAGNRKYTNLRAVHNYWHLKREICNFGSE